MCFFSTACADSRVTVADTPDAEPGGPIDSGTSTSLETKQLLLLYAQQFKAEGDQAARRGSYGEAAARYLAALKLDPDYTDAEEALASVRAVLDRRGGDPTDGIYSITVPLTEQQTKAQYRAALKRADAALVAGNCAPSRNLIQHL